MFIAGHHVDVVGILVVLVDYPFVVTFGLERIS